jgi:hypothetical protein
MTKWTFDFSELDNILTEHNIKKTPGWKRLHRPKDSDSNSIAMEEVDNQPQIKQTREGNE